MLYGVLSLQDTIISFETCCNDLNRVALFKKIGGRAATVDALHVAPFIYALVLYY